MIAAVVLSAGASARMGGQPKALLTMPGTDRTFLSRVVATLREGGVDDVLVVVGFHAREIRQEIERTGESVRIVENPDHQAGQLSSLLAGLAILDRPGITGMLVMPVDMPCVSVDTVRRVIDAHARTRAGIVRPERGGRHGHPVLFDRSMFDALRSADPEVGARAVIREHPEAVVNVPVENEGAFVDVDTPDDYQRLPPPSGS
jgi:molybdenum cofactor cytidylyltransferase